MSREHYISATVLKAMSSNGSIHVGGLPWQPHQLLRSIGIQSLQSKILCQTHNSGLSHLDDVAGRLFSTLHDADKRLEALPSILQVDGPCVERWFLKVLCGLNAAASLDNGVVPDKWKMILSGESWPKSWGLYVPSPSRPQVLAQEFYLETRVHPGTKEVLAATFRVAGVSFNILLGRPDNPQDFGVHRPRAIIFRYEENEKQIELSWPFRAEGEIIYTKVGTTKERPPQFKGWKE